jgi:hypothetical protein
MPVGGDNDGAIFDQVLRVLSGRVRPPTPPISKQSAVIIRIVNPLAGNAQGNTSARARKQTDQQTSRQRAGDPEAAVMTMRMWHSTWIGRQNSFL